MHSKERDAAASQYLSEFEPAAVSGSGHCYQGAVATTFDIACAEMGGNGSETLRDVLLHVAPDPKVDLESSRAVCLWNVVACFQLGVSSGQANTRGGCQEN